MKTHISFLFYQESDDNEPYTFFKKVNENKYELPTYEVPEEENNIDKFISEKFKSITNVYPIIKNNDGWINIFLTTTLVYDNKSSFLYMCKIPLLIELKEFEKIKMSEILNLQNIDKEYLDQIIDGFNYIHR